MSGYVEKAAVLRVIFDSVGKPATEIYQKVREVPEADAVEVVRCSECRCRDPEDKKCDSGALERAGCVFPVDDDYFCAYGKR